MRCSILRVSLTVLCLAALAAGAATAQNPPPAPPRNDSALAAMPAELQTVVPLFSRMMAAMLQGTLAVLARPETAEQLATFDRNYLDALQHHGFTRDEALRIVASVGLPLPGAPK
ncbi:MAG TPA: hypothetical protein VMF70_14865 [Gemmatimonadales bacterium]|nr:hypothetical protein [Gemmatimonadales bacterium]